MSYYLSYSPLSLVVVIMAILLVCSCAVADEPVRPDPDPLVFRHGVQIFQGTDDGSPAIISRKIASVAPEEDFRYTLVAVGSPEIKVKVEGLPKGLTYSPKGPSYTLRQEEGKPEQVAVTGVITGKYTSKKDHVFTITATNDKGTVTEKVTIRSHKLLAPTPPMGWLSWEWYRDSVSQENMVKIIDGMAKLGLNKHGWKYVVIDDTWQQEASERRPGQAIKPNTKKFPDMKGLSDYTRKKGYILGIYTSPWSTSYAGKDGSGHFEALDVKQFAEWGIGYVKIDYRPYEVKRLSIIHDAFKEHGKDILLSFSNAGMRDESGSVFLSELTDVWRTGGDINPTWECIREAVYDDCLGREGWKDLRKGHWPDPDMLQIGPLREGQEMPHNLQHYQMSLWTILPAPLLLSCDVNKLNDFHMSLLTNDEVIAVNQDSLGKFAQPVNGDPEVLYKPLSDGTIAVGFFNRSDAEKEMSVSFDAIGMKNVQPVRDLWAKKDLGKFTGEYKAKVGSHCAVLLKVGAK